MSTCSLASLELIQDLAPDRIDRGVGSLSRAAPNWQRGSAFSSHDDDADLSWKREEKEKHVTSRYSSSPLLFFFAWVRNRHREMQCVFQRHNPFVASILHLNGVHLGHAETAELLNAGCKVLRWSCKAVNSRGFHWRLSAGVHFLANLSWNCHCMGIWSDLIFRSACSWGGWMSRGKKIWRPGMLDKVVSQHVSHDNHSPVISRQYLPSFTAESAFVNAWQPITEKIASMWTHAACHRHFCLLIYQ